MRADSLIAEIITDARKDLLYFPRCDGEDQRGPPCLIAKTVLSYLYQFRVPLNCLFNPLWLSADVTLCHGYGAVLP